MKNTEREFALQAAINQLKMGCHLIPHELGGFVCLNGHVSCAGGQVGDGESLIAEAKAIIETNGEDSLRKEKTLEIIELTSAEAVSVRAYLVIIELTSAEVVSVRASHEPEFLGVKTQEEITLAENEYGFIVGKRSNMLQGVFCQPGLVHPGFKGVLTPFFIVYGRWVAPVGTKIAHVIISKDKE